MQKVPKIGKIEFRHGGGLRMCSCYGVKGQFAVIPIQGNGDKGVVLIMTPGSCADKKGICRGNQVLTGHTVTGRENGLWDLGKMGTKTIGAFIIQPLPILLIFNDNIGILRNGFY